MPVMGFAGSEHPWSVLSPTILTVLWHVLYGFCPWACLCSCRQGLLVRHLQLVYLSVLALELVILLARSFGDLPGYLHFPFVPVFLGF